jgi:hypothetical protein
MTTNDLISLIIKNHMNADCLAQIANAVECLQEQLIAVEEAREQIRKADQMFTYRVKVFRTDGGVDYIKCVSYEDAQVARALRFKEGGVKCAVIGTREDMVELSNMFRD